MGAAMFGTVPLFSIALLNSGLEPEAVAFWRFATIAVLLAPTLIGMREGLRPLLWAVGGGAAMGLGWIGYVAALQHMPVAEASLLYMTYPFFAIAIATLIFQERTRIAHLVAAGLVLIAAATAWPATGAGGVPLSAVGLALLAPAAYGLILNIVSHRLKDLAPLRAVAAIGLGSALAIFPLLLCQPVEAVIPQQPSALAWMLGFSLVTALLPQTLYVLCAPHVGPARTAIAGSFELPSMFTIAVLAFGETITPAQIVSAALIVAAITIGAVNHPGKPAPR